MKPSIDRGITYSDEGYHLTCKGCGSYRTFKSRAAALKSLKRGSCFNCRMAVRDTSEMAKRRAVSNEELGVYRNSDGAWCSSCSVCGREQPYTKNKHARSSARGGWKCKSCSGKQKTVYKSRADGFLWSDLNTFKRTAKYRSIAWELEDDILSTLWNRQGGKCSMTGIGLVKHPRTWSIDRIDNTKEYVPSNVHLVDKRVNLMKGSLPIAEFVHLCKLIAKEDERNA